MSWRSNISVSECLVLMLFAVGSLSVAEAQDSPILVAHVTGRTVDTSADAKPVAPGPTSAIARSRIAARLAVSTTRPPLVQIQTAAQASEAILMAPFVVDARLVRVEIPTPPNRFFEAMKSGRLLSYRGSAITGEVNMNGEQNRIGHGRILLGFGFSW